MAEEKEEIFPIVDVDGKVIGKASRTECHSGSFLLHPVVHLHVFNSAGELYLQKRAMTKKIQPGMWDTSVGGHVDYGETIEEALSREVREELGMTDYEPRFLLKYAFKSTIEAELVYVFTTIYDGEIKPDNGEIDEGRFWRLAEIKANIGKGIFTPNFEGEIYKVGSIN